jgi:high-affinity nickel permease
MQDFENKDAQDEVEITDLDLQGEVSGTSLPYILLRPLRKLCFSANIHAKLTILALLIGVIVLLFLLHPHLHLTDLYLL